MRRTILHTALIVSSAILLCSCSKEILSPSRPYYTSVRKILTLSKGKSIAEANALLGIGPYQVYHLQSDGSSLVSYKYRVMDREVFGSSTPLHNDSSQVDGKPIYTAEGTLYAFFEDGKLQSLISERGVDDGENLILDNNTLQFVSSKGVSRYTVFDFGPEKSDTGATPYIIPLNRAGIINAEDPYHQRKRSRRSNVVLEEPSSLPAPFDETQFLKKPKKKRRFFW